MLPGSEPQSVRVLGNREEKAAKSSPTPIAADLPIDQSVRELLLVPELRQPGGPAAASWTLLHELQGAGLGVVDEIAAGALGERRLELSGGDADEFLKVERDAGNILSRPRRRLV